MSKKWKIIAPLAVGAVGALAAGIATLLQKLPKQESPAENSPAAPAEKRVTGCYSFISGFRDAATVELSLDYDPEKYSFAVMEEDFLNYSSDSHVAILWGEDFNLQLEYASYFSGEDFAAHTAALAEKYQTRGELRCGGLSGVWVLDGDNVSVHLPIPGDEHSYLLVTVQKTENYDGAVTDLVGDARLIALLASIRFNRI